MTEKAKKYNEDAAERIFFHNNPDPNAITIDLHGLHVKEALKALRQTLIIKKQSIIKFVTKNFNLLILLSFIELYTNILKKQKTYMYVITGKGSNSENGVPKLRPNVITYLKQNKVKYEVKY